MDLFFFKKIHVREEVQLVEFFHIWGCEFHPQHHVTRAWWCMLHSKHLRSRDKRIRSSNHPRLYSEFKASQNFIRLQFKETKNKTKQKTFPARFGDRYLSSQYPTLGRWCRKIVNLKSVWDIRMRLPKTKGQEIWLHCEEYLLLF